LPRNLTYEPYEGIVESDRWFGPLFTNIRLIKTDVPIVFSTETPVLQVQPLHRSTYAEEVTNRFGMVPALADLPPQAWERYETNIVKPREIGAYATEVRRRRRSGCPVHAG